MFKPMINKKSIHLAINRKSLIQKETNPFRLYQRLEFDKENNKPKEIDQKLDFEVGQGILRDVNIFSMNN